MLRVARADADADQQPVMRSPPPAAARVAPRTEPACARPPASPPSGCAGRTRGRRRARGPRRARSRGRARPRRRRAVGRLDARVVELVAAHARAGRPRRVVGGARSPRGSRASAARVMCARDGEDAAHRAPVELVARGRAARRTRRGSAGRARRRRRSRRAAPRWPTAPRRRPRGSRRRGSARRRAGQRLVGQRVERRRARRRRAQQLEVLLVVEGERGAARDRDPRRERLGARIGLPRRARRVGRGARQRERARRGRSAPRPPRRAASIVSRARGSRSATGTSPRWRSGTSSGVVAAQRAEHRHADGRAPRAAAPRGLAADAVEDHARDVDRRGRSVR